MIEEELFYRRLRLYLESLSVVLFPWLLFLERKPAIDKSFDLMTDRETKREVPYSK